MWFAAVVLFAVLAAGITVYCAANDDVRTAANEPPNSAPRTARRARKSGPGQAATGGLWLIDPLDNL